MRARAITLLSLLILAVASPSIPTPCGLRRDESSMTAAQ
jgi:hypothetical protein